MIESPLNQLSDRLLDIIRRRPGHFFSLARLAGRLKCPQENLHQAVRLLHDSGYIIRVRKSAECAFISAPDRLLAAEIAHGLKTKFVGRTVYSFQSVQSTNTIAARLADVHAAKGTLPHGLVPEGTIVIAEAQTKGRGRLGKKWHSPVGVGLYLSIILYPAIDPAKAPGLSLLTAVSLADTFASCDSFTVNIKWPNDCLINGRKAAGILTELSAEIGRVHYVIVGLGVNVNQKRGAFPSGLSTATSLRAETKKVFSRVELLQRFLKNFERDYLLFRKNGLASLRRRIIAYSNLIGQNVRLDLRGAVVSGKAVDIDECGNLILEIAGHRHAFNSGEVTVLRPTPSRSA